MSISPSPPLQRNKQAVLGWTYTMPVEAQTYSSKIAALSRIMESDDSERRV